MKTYRFTNLQISSLTLITLLGVLLSVSFHEPLVLGFLPGFIFLVSLIINKGIPLKSIWEICFEGVRKTETVILILLLVSFVLPSWYVSGTIQQLVSIAVYLITPDHFLLLAFLISLFFSMILGTSVGTLSAVGIPIMGSALSLNLSPEMVAGALISGAFVGDRTSPFSSAFQLLSHTVEVPVRKQFRALFVTTIFAIFIGVLFFGVLDLQNDVKVHGLTSFNWEELSFIKFMPPLILVAFVMLRIGIIYGFLSSIVAASFIAIGKGASVFDLFHSLLFGVENMGGGLANMYLLLLFLALAGAYNGLLEKFGIIQPLIDGWLSTSKTFVGDSVKTIAATFGISLIAANQTLPIILTGRAFLPHWTTQQTKEDLARVMADSTMLFPGMIPWSVLAIMCSTIVGVPVLAYLPYAVFLWALPFITVIVSAKRQLKMNRNQAVIKENYSDVS